VARHVRHRHPRQHGPADHVAESAVLVLIYEEERRARVVLTRRAVHMRRHAHEVSFPGGRRDPGDRDLWMTALREAHEETGLDPATVTRIGSLDPFVTVGSRTLVHPYVAEVPARPTLVAAPAEVDSIRHTPLDELLRPEVWREEIWPMADDTERAITFFELPGDTVWGATGAMLRQLLALATNSPDRILGGPA
jgi:8-oxo-dGTP pyrophosphatase MutT (NUDIX family)